MNHTTGTIAQLVGGSLVGPGELKIDGVEQIDAARRGQLTFIGVRRYAEQWPHSGASAALVTRGIEVDPTDGKALIFVDNADLAMVQVLELFAPTPVGPPPGVHGSSVIDPSARIGQGVCIGPNCNVGPDVSIGDRSVLHASVTVLDEASVGDDGTLWPGVVIRERCHVGNRCIVHPNVTIGSDGFGYRRTDSGQGPVWVKVPQIGTVRIGDDVEIGAGACIDRAKFSATVIGPFTKIDNLVQIGHNCQIGRGVVIAGCCGIAGSVTIGDGAVLGGMVAVRDHVRIGARAQLAGCSQVIHDVPAGQIWGGSPAIPVKKAIKQAQALKKLPELVKQVRRR